MRLLFFFTTLLLPTLMAYGKTSAIVESSTTNIVIDDIRHMTILKSTRIKILDEEGYRHALYFQYYNRLQRVRSVTYTIFDSKGKKIKRFTKGDAVDVMFNASYEIADVRTLYIDPNYRNFPFVVEIEEELVYEDGFLHLPTWMPRHTYGLAVQQAELSLKCSADFLLRSKGLNGIQDPSIRSEGSHTFYSWKISNLTAEQKPASNKLFIADQPKVVLAPLSFTFEKYAGSIENWSAFGEWFLQLNEGRDKISDETKLFLDDLKTAHGSNVRAIADSVYKFMQRKTKYISIQLGIGGYQSIPSDVVERTGYGDCKALTNYMKAMLAHLQIPSNYVLVQAGADAPDVIGDFPSSQFNHVFLAVPVDKDTLWYECTSQTSPAAYTGSFTDDRNVLWIKKGASTLIRTPARSQSQNWMRNKCMISIKSDGDADLELNVSESGVFYDEAARYQHAPKDVVENINYSRFDYKDFTLKSFSSELHDQDTPYVSLRYKIDVQGLAKPLGTKMLIPMNTLPSVGSMFHLDILHQATEIRRGFTLKDSVVVSLPEDYRAGTIPEPVLIKTEFGSFSLSGEQINEHQIIIRRVALFKKGTYRKEQFASFQEMLRKIKTAELQKIIVHSKT